MTIRSILTVACIVVLALGIGIMLPKPKEEAHEATPPARQTNEDKEMPAVTELRPGKGRIAEPGDMVTVHFELFLPDGKKVESSRDKGKPYRFLLGGGLSVKGWDKGIAGARVGSIRKIVVPPSLGYGARGSEDGKIPPNTTLTFVVEVLKVEKIEDEPLLDPLLRPMRHGKGSPSGGK